MLTSGIATRLDMDRCTYACSPNKSGDNSPASNTRTPRSKGTSTTHWPGSSGFMGSMATVARKSAGSRRGDAEPPCRWAVGRVTARRITAARTDEGSTSTASPTAKICISGPRTRMASSSLLMSRGECLDSGLGSSPVAHGARHNILGQCRSARYGS
jgi:hypothetical protein